MRNSVRLYKSENERVFAMEEKGCKCSFPEGVRISPDGVNEVDPCVYEDVEIHTNATVIVSRCKHCGHYEVSWLRTDQTEDIILEDGEMPEGL